MIQKFATVSLFVLLMSVSVFAQTRYEIHPYAGGFLPFTKTADYGEFRNEGIYGIKGGVLVPSNWELGGHFGYINHFEIKPGTGFVERMDPRNRASVRALLVEMTTDYNISREMFGPKVMPFVGLGLGVLQARVAETPAGDHTIFLSGGIPTAENANATDGRRVIALNNKDSFFTFSYGGGLKGEQLWGPVGLRADFRGRTMPNLLGRQVSWAEITGGLTFVWGER
jgi:hypothetical protein